MTDLGRAVAVLRSGGLVAFPTETVYGLGADAANAAAVRRIYAVKRRPPDHPVIVHIAAAEQLAEVAIDIPEWATALATAAWPGPLALVVRRRPGAVCDEVTGGRATVGVRVPAHPLALELLGTFGAGVAAPSANRFGRVSPTTAAHVAADLGGDTDVILDGGACAVGVESTIVDVTGEVPRILREGAIGVEAVAAATGRPPVLATAGEVAAPGTLASHYAPHATVRVVSADSITPEEGAVLLAPASVATPEGLDRLAAPHDPAEFARTLYASLRVADAMGARVILVVPPDGPGIAAAVRDRLRRAAADGDR